MIKSTDKHLDTAQVRIEFSGKKKAIKQPYVQLVLQHAAKKGSGELCISYYRNQKVCVQLC